MYYIGSGFGAEEAKSVGGMEAQQIRQKPEFDNLTVAIQVKLDFCEKVSAGLWEAMNRLADSQPLPADPVQQSESPVTDTIEGRLQQIARRVDRLQGGLINLKQQFERVV